MTCVPFLTGEQARADTLKITSAPPGATVEINGVIVGKTPYEAKIPGGYLHKTKTAFGTRLQHVMVARVYKEGYTVQEIILTEGPFEWRALSGQSHGIYWLLKQEHFDVTLEPVSTTFTGSVRTSAASDSNAVLKPEMPVDKLVEIASPAVVLLRGSTKEGTGFFITDTGVIATNAHVARGESSLVVIFQSGSQGLGKIVYIDTQLDLALVKADGRGFPHLPLAELAEVRPGQTVIAIGNPSHGMPNTVTKGIVSAVGSDGKLGPGTWIQTDAAINPGNSGGPLLNTSGEVVGINTQKFFSTQGSSGIPLQGIGFALSSSDLIRVLRKFYPEAMPVPPAMQSPGTAGVMVTSEPAGAEIFVDGKFVGQTPSTVALSTGSHHVLVKANGKKDWERDLEVIKDAQITLHPVLEPQP